MTGLRMGEAVLFSGRSATLALPLAARTGLSGRCLVFGTPDATAALDAAAQREGLLVETAEAPPADATFDLAVVEAGGPWAPAAAACLPAVRPGGRIVIASGPPRTGLLGRLGGQPPGPEVEAAIVSALTGQGWHRARGIGTRDGVLFVEAFRHPPASA